MYCRHGRHYHSGGGLWGLLAIIVIAIYALPIVGVFLMIGGKTNDEKVLGVILTVVGIIIWSIIGTY